MQTCVALLAMGVMLTACARGDDRAGGADSTITPQAPEVTVGDTSAAMSPADKASTDTSSAASASGGKSKSRTPPPDSAPPPARPRPGMRPEARDRQPWQIPPSDDTARPDSTRSPDNPPAP